ncbi:MAG: lysophospholipase [Myxococcaceae bacterium]
MRATHDEGFFSAQDGKRLYWQSDMPPQPLADVAMVHGYGDHSGRYVRLRRALTEAGLAAHGFDYRGHGRSDGARGHCKAFSEFADDLERFWTRVRENSAGRKTFLFAHSHGVLVALDWLSRKPGGVQGLVLSAPFLEFGFTPPPLKVLGARVVGLALPSFPFQNALEVGQLTRDTDIQRETEQDALYHRVATPAWFFQVRKAQAMLRTRAAQIHLPTFLFYGSEDPISAVGAMRSFFESLAAKDKTTKAYVGAKHETFHDLRRAEVERDIVKWISSRL